MTETLLKQKNETAKLLLSNGKRIISKSINEKSVHNLLLALRAINEKESSLRLTTPPSLAKNSRIGKFQSYPNLSTFLSSSYSLNAKSLYLECKLLLVNFKLSQELAIVLKLIKGGCERVVEEFVRVDVGGREVDRGDGVLLILTNIS